MLQAIRPETSYTDQTATWLAPALQPLSQPIAAQNCAAHILIALLHSCGQ